MTTCDDDDPRTLAERLLRGELEIPDQVLTSVSQKPPARSLIDPNQRYIPTGWAPVRWPKKITLPKR